MSVSLQAPASVPRRSRASLLSVKQQISELFKPNNQSSFSQVTELQVHSVSELDLWITFCQTTVNTQSDICTKELCVQAQTLLRGLKSPTDFQIVSRGYGHQQVREAGQRHKQAGHCLSVEPKRPGLVTAIDRQMIYEPKQPIERPGGETIIVRLSFSPFLLY